MLIQAFAQLGSAGPTTFSSGFDNVLYMIIGILLFNLIALKLTGFKANANVSKLLLACYVVFLIAAIIQLATANV